MISFSSKNKKGYGLGILGVFGCLVFFVGTFVITRGADPQTAELTFIENSVGNVGSVLPASCESGFVHAEPANPAGDPNVCANQLTFTADAASVPSGGSANLTWSMPTGDGTPWFENTGYSNPHGGWVALPEAAKVLNCMASGAWSGERYKESDVTVDSNGSITPNYSYPTSPNIQYGYLIPTGGWHWVSRAESGINTGPITQPQTYTLQCAIQYRTIPYVNTNIVYDGIDGDGNPFTYSPTFLYRVGNVTRNVTVGIDVPPPTVTMDIGPATTPLYGNPTTQIPYHGRIGSMSYTSQNASRCTLGQVAFGNPSYVFSWDVPTSYTWSDAELTGLSQIAGNGYDETWGGGFYFSITCYNDANVASNQAIVYGIIGPPASVNVNFSPAVTDTVQDRSGNRLDLGTTHNINDEGGWGEVGKGTKAGDNTLRQTEIH